MIEMPVINEHCLIEVREAEYADAVVRRFVCRCGEVLHSMHQFSTHLAYQAVHDYEQRRMPQPREMSDGQGKA